MVVKTPLGSDDNAKGSRAPGHLRARLLIEGGYERDLTSHDQKMKSRLVLLATSASLDIVWGHFICDLPVATYLNAPKCLRFPIIVGLRFDCCYQRS